VSAGWTLSDPGEDAGEVLGPGCLGDCVGCRFCSLGRVGGRSCGVLPGRRGVVGRRGFGQGLGEGTGDALQGGGDLGGTMRTARKTVKTASTAMSSAAITAAGMSMVPPVPQLGHGARFRASVLS